MKLAFFNLTANEHKRYAKEFPDAMLSGDPVSRSALQGIEAISVNVHSTLDKATLSRISNLKFITTRSTGFNHIDLSYCKSHKIIVSRVPVYGDETIAEHAMALLLTYSRKTHLDNVAHLMTCGYAALTGFDLKDKVLGVVGTGNIGRHMIKIARGFGMKILAFDPHPDEFMSEILVFKYVSLNTLIKKSDIISLHVPLLPATYHLIDDAAISKMKDGVILVNTARGAVIDTPALFRGLESGKVQGACLDVIEGEDDLLSRKRTSQARMAHAVLSQPNVLYTPHNAFNTVEALDRMFKVTVENIKAFEKGRPINTV